MPALARALPVVHRGVVPLHRDALARRAQRRHRRRGGCRGRVTPARVGIPLWRSLSAGIYVTTTPSDRSCSRRLHGVGGASGIDLRDHYTPACAVPPALNTEVQRTELLRLRGLYTRFQPHRARPSQYRARAVPGVQPGGVTHAASPARWSPAIRARTSGLEAALRSAETDWRKPAGAGVPRTHACWTLARVLRLRRRPPCLPRRTTPARAGAAGRRCGPSRAAAGHSRSRGRRPLRPGRSGMVCLLFASDWLGDGGTRDWMHGRNLCFLAFVVS